MTSTSDMMALEKMLTRLHGYSHQMSPEMGHMMRDMLPRSSTELLKGMSRNERRQLFKLLRREEAERRKKQAATRGP